MASPRSQRGEIPKRPSRWLLQEAKQKALSLFMTTFFSVRSNWKYLCGLRTFPVPTKIIFNAFRNNFGLVIFICEKQTRMRFHYSWRQFFASTKSENISVGLRIIPVPTKMILDSFWNNFRLVNFICEKQPKRYRQLRNIFGFYFWKFQKVSRMILAPSKNYQACAETILT